jgi:hypothetical protein
MKQLVVKLTDVHILQYAPLGTASTYTAPVQLDPNYLSYYSGGGFASIVP